MSNQYVCKCGQCHKVMRDQKENPIYVVALDKYFCSDKCWDKCWDKWRKKNG